jgi:DNA-directed RNA polymerase specialized sigma24 family protein
MQSRDGNISAEQILSDSAWLRRLASRLVTDAAERDEVVQRVWLEALTYAPREANLRPWLTVVLRNVARMRFRSDARRRAREEAAATPERAATPEEPSRLVRWRRQGHAGERR